MPYVAALRRELQPIMAIDTSKIAVAPGIRKGIGVIVPLTVGVVTGHPLDGIVAASGALLVGYTDRGDAYGVRALTMLAASIGIALFTFIGASVTHIVWLALVVMAVWGAIAGLLVAVGPSTSLVGTQAAIALSVALAFPLPLPLAARHAGAVLVGALFQTALALAAWPLRRLAPERQALAAAFRLLAAFAADTSSPEASQRAADALADARGILAATVPRFGPGLQGEALRALLHQGDRIQIELSLFAEIERGDAQHLAAAHDVLRQLLADAQAVLSEIARRLEAHRAPAERNTLQHVERDARCLLALAETPPATSRSPEERSADRLTLAELAAHAELLRRLLRDAFALASSWAHPQAITLPGEVPENERPPRLRLQSATAILRANLTLRSAALRHAIRQGITLAVAVALYRIFGLPRGYWIPLTALAVLKPDFSTTFTRGIARGAGTVLGAGVATILVAVFVPSRPILLVALFLLAAAAYSLFAANYAIFSLLITALVAVLISVEGIPTPPIIEARVVNTLIGAALALTAFAVWPSWERPLVPENLAALLDAYRQYFNAVVCAYTTPATVDVATVEACRRAARLARSNAEASVQRSLSDPVRFRTNADIALGVLGRAHRFVQSVLALEAQLLRPPPPPALPELAPFAADVDRALRALCALLLDEPVPPWPPLGERERQLVAAFEARMRQATAPQTTLTFLIAETERIVESVAMLRHLLSSASASTITPSRHDAEHVSR